MNELYPRISSCCSTDQFRERIGFKDRLKKLFLRIAAVLFIICMVIFIVRTGSSEQPLWQTALAGIPQSAIMTLMLCALIYMCYGYYLLARVFWQAGSFIPMLGAGSSRKKLDRQMKQYDPYFFVPIFEGKLVSLLQAILYSDDRTDLTIYEGNDDLFSFDDLVDTDYRGSFKLRQFGIRENRISILLDVFAENCYAGKHIRHKNERFLVRMERNMHTLTDPGFSIHAVRCRNCGSSFDAIHVRNCPYCGQEYNSADDDWVITEIRKQ